MESSIMKYTFEQVSDAIQYMKECIKDNGFGTNEKRKSTKETLTWYANTLCDEPALFSKPQKNSLDKEILQIALDSML